MNFTREPIIETVIMPREGCKLLVRNSKGSGQEEYYVDSVEVVSFGHSFFFRSQERPKSFLVPVSDYEILEQKEARMSLKNVAPERSIKIGGGREGPVRAPRDTAPETEAFEPQERDQSQERPPMDRPPMDRDRKRDNKRRRGRRGGGGSRPEGSMQHEPREQQPPVDESFPRDDAHHGSGPRDNGPQSEGRSEEVKAPSFISKLFPPPPTLIKDSLSRYKTAEAEGEASFPKEERFEEPLFDAPLPKDPTDSEEEEPPFED